MVSTPHHTTRGGRGCEAWLSVAALALAWRPSVAHAVDESQPVTEVCQWAPAVGIPRCSGAYVGGLLITAAHCLTQGDQGWTLMGAADEPSIWFGEYFAGGGVELKIPVDTCMRYPGGYLVPSPFGNNELYVGVDLGFCTLVGGWSGSPIPPMVVGCESAYLSDGIFAGAPPEMYAVGKGDIGPQGERDHRKRYWRTTLDSDAPQVYDNGAFRLQNDAMEFPNMLRPGDSGGPLYVEMADGTWRLIGVLSSTKLDHTYWQPVPPFLRWLESSSGADLTPCHVWDEGAGHYVFDRYGTECTWEVGFALHPDLPGQTTWESHCFGPEGGGLDACAGWDPDDGTNLSAPPLFPPAPPPLQPPRLSGEPVGDGPAACPPGTAPAVATEGPDLRLTSGPDTCEVLGGGDDVVFGTGEDVVTLLGGGDDLFFAAAGDAQVAGGAGNDAISTGAGEDRLHGGPGGDLLLAGPGRDQLHGGPGPDALFAGIGDDALFGGRGGDVLVGGDGADIVVGDRGADVLEGGDGPDVVLPGAGDDLVLAGSGDDVVVVLAPCELVAGEVLRGGTGHDTLLLPLPAADAEAMGVLIEGFEEVVVHPVDDAVDVCDAAPRHDGGLSRSGAVRLALSVVPPKEPGGRASGVAVALADETGDLGITLSTPDTAWTWLRGDGRVFLGDAGPEDYARAFGSLPVAAKGEEEPPCAWACCS